MTSTTDTAGHPEVTEISDLTEGLLPPSRTAAVRRHLDDCTLCADVHASLEDIRGVLGTLPGPPRMPIDVAGRIDAALAAEALLNATARSADADPDATDLPAGISSSRPVSGESRGAHVSRETSTGTDRPAGRARVGTGPGRPNRTRRRRRGTVVLGALFTAATLGLGGLLLQSLGDNTNTPGSTTTAPNHTDSVNTFTKGKLKSQVADLLAKSDSSDRWGSATTPNEPSTLKDSTAQVPGCIQNGIGRQEAALAFKQGTYEGTNAYLVVLPDASDATRVTAYVVDSTCVSKSSFTAGKVLLQQSYARD